MLTMSFPTLLAPSKTFLLGEYSALNGGPALLITTSPYFSLTTDHNAQMSLRFAAESPAGKLWRAHDNKKDQDTVVFHDPYQGLGGFGASSAQFILLARYLGQDDPWKIWALYQQYAAQPNHIPSGADVMAQLIGKIVFFHAADGQLEQLQWPFTELVIALIHTGKKIATHSHLITLTQKDFSVLYPIVKSGYESIKNQQATSLITAINSYAHEMSNLTIVAEHTQQLLAKLRENPQVLACKGCGAMGADVVLSIIAAKEKATFLQWATQQSLHVVFCDNQFAEGLLS